jgi:hypothetical protein
MNTTATSPASVELTEPLLAVLERAAQPLTFFQIQRRLPRSLQTRTEELRSLLQELAAQGRIHAFAPYRSNAPRYWTRDPRQFAQLVIVEVLGEHPITQRELMLKIRKRLQGVSEGDLRQMLSQMLVEGRVRKLPPRLGGRSNLLSAREVQPRDYLIPVFRALQDTLGEVYKRLESEGVSRATFVEEAEAMWRSLSWDDLTAEAAPRQERETEQPPPQQQTETPSEALREPASAESAPRPEEVARIEEPTPQT